MTLLALCCALAAFALLGLATDAQHQRWRGTRLLLATKRRMHTLAWAAMIASFVLAVAGRGWIMGPVVWPGLLMLAAGAVFLFLNLAPPPVRGGVHPSASRERT